MELSSVNSLQVQVTLHRWNPKNTSILLYQLTQPILFVKFESLKFQEILNFLFCEANRTFQKILRPKRRVVHPLTRMLKTNLL